MPQTRRQIRRRTIVKATNDEIAGAVQEEFLDGPLV